MLVVTISYNAGLCVEVEEVMIVSGKVVYRAILFLFLDRCKIVAYNFAEIVYCRLGLVGV